MHLSVRGLGMAMALLWGLAVFLTGVINLGTGYGEAFLEVMRSVYPGFSDVGGFGGVVVGTLYALVDGAVCGALLAWLYNKLSAPRPASV